MSSSEDSQIPDAFAEQNKRLLKTGAYSDFVIECGGREFKVHRSILCPQSEFLEVLCNSAFEEGIARKASLKEVEPDIFEKALDFLYTGTFNDASCEMPDDPAQRVNKTLTQHVEGLPTALMREDMGTSHNSAPQIIANQDLGKQLYMGKSCEGFALLLNVKLYNLAEFLQVPKLKKESLQRCTKLMKEHFDAANFLDGIKEALAHINEQDLDLRAQILRSCIENWQTVAKCHALEVLLMEYQPIAWIVLKEKAAEYEKNYSGEIQNVCLLAKHLVTVQKDLSMVKDELDSVYKLFRDHANCRNCGQQFGNLEKPHHGKPSLRCSKCRCRYESLSR